MAQPAGGNRAFVASAIPALAGLVVGRSLSCGARSADLRSFGLGLGVRRMCDADLRWGTGAATRKSIRLSESYGCPIMER